MSKIEIAIPKCANCPQNATFSCLWCETKVCRTCAPHHAAVHGE